MKFNIGELVFHCINRKCSKIQLQRLIKQNKAHIGIIINAGVEECEVLWDDGEYERNSVQSLVKA